MWLRIKPISVHVPMVSPAEQVSSYIYVYIYYETMGSPFGATKVIKSLLIILNLRGGADAAWLHTSTKYPPPEPPLGGPMGPPWVLRKGRGGRRRRGCIQGSPPLRCHLRTAHFPYRLRVCTEPGGLLLLISILPKKFAGWGQPRPVFFFSPPHMWCATPPPRLPLTFPHPHSGTLCGWDLAKAIHLLRKWTSKAGGGGARGHISGGTWGVVWSAPCSSSIDPRCGSACPVRPTRSTPHFSFIS
nr:hypothetical protein [Morchella crassipes]